MAVIKFQAFKLGLAEQITKGQLFQAVAGHEEVVTKFKGWNRLVRIQETEKYYIGSLWTLKDESRYPQINTKTLEMAIRKLEPGNSLALFNFFVISKRNLNGLYSSYQHSASYSVLGGVFNQMCGGQDDGEGRLVTTEPLIGVRSLQAVLQEWERIKRLEFTLNVLTPQVGDFKSLADYVTNEKHTLSFHKNSPIRNVAASVIAWFRQSDATRAKVVGIDGHHQPTSLDMIDITEIYGQHDYEKVIASRNFLSELPKSTLILALLEAANEHPEIFDIDVE